MSNDKSRIELKKFYVICNDCRSSEDVVVHFHAGFAGESAVTFGHLLIECKICERSEEFP